MIVVDPKNFSMATAPANADLPSHEGEGDGKMGPQGLQINVYAHPEHWNEDPLYEFPVDYMKMPEGNLGRLRSSTSAELSDVLESKSVVGFR